MTMSAKGLETAGVTLDAGLHREKTASEPAGPSQCKHPDANRPSEGQGRHAGNNFWKNPPRTIPALKRKVVEC